MSDHLKKNVSFDQGFQETSVVRRERRFKKSLSVNLKNNNGTLTALSNVANRDSQYALEELLQCGICLERLSAPRMLPCQHTYCLECLRTHVTAKNLKIAHKDNASKGTKFTINAGINSMSCPVCQMSVALPRGHDSLDQLPKNLYLESLLKVMEEPLTTTPTSSKPVENYRCVSCQMVSLQQEQVCQHCMQIFCSVCWGAHLSELDSNLSLLVKQLTESEEKLKHKLDSFVNRCRTMEEKIRKSAMMKVEAILRDEKQLIGEVVSLQRESGISSDILRECIDKLKEDIHTKAQDKSNNQKVTTFLNLHKETSKLLEQVNYFGEARLSFDPDSFKLEQISEGIYNDHDDHHPGQLFHHVGDPLESVDSMTKYYKAKLFNPKLIWNKCPRPAGLGIPPWDASKLYIAATDSHSLLIMDRIKFKLIDRITNKDMDCPTGITFSKSTKQVFVTDKWRHCIHVFSEDNDYLRCITGLKMRGPDGIAIGPNEELIVSDTGNDRILVVDAQTGEKIRVIGAHKGVTQLNFPTSVTVFGQSILVADSGNNRVKRYSLNGELEQEIGSFGKNPGQFRSPEAVAVDPLGFVLVGDAGNARIQVFTPDGQLVKIFGSKSGFGWISGMLVTSDLDIIAADNKTRTLRIF